MDSKIPKPSFLKKPTGPLSLPGNARLPLSRDLLNLPPMGNNSTMLAVKMRTSPEPRRPNQAAGFNRAKLRRSRSATELNRIDFHRPKYVSALSTIPSKSGNITAATVAMMTNSELVRPVSANTGLGRGAGGGGGGGGGGGLMRRSRSACDITRRPNESTASSATTTSSVSSTTGLKRQPTSANGSSGVPAKMTKMGMIPPSRVGLTKTPCNKNVKPPSNAPAVTTLRKAAPITKATNAPVRREIGAGSSKVVPVTNGPKASGAAPKGPSKTMTKRIPPYDYKARFANLQEKHKVLLEKYEKLHEEHASREQIQELYDDCSRELDDLKQQHEELQLDLQTVREERDTLDQANQELTTSLQQTEAELKQYRDRFAATNSELVEAKRLLKELEDKANFLEEENFTLQETNQRNAELLFHANIERKDLHNMVMDLRGNIRVFCRVRPPLPSEAHRLECCWKFLDEQSIELVAMDSSNKRYEFSFDHVFHSRTQQEDIFDNVSPLVQSALDGYNVCIFAYGQTGSGKTYTMDGVPDSMGVIPRTIDLIFNAVADYRRFGWEYEIRVNFLEIYNEILYDLLDTTGMTKELEIKMASAKSKTEVYVSNIIEETVTSPGRLHQLMNIAKMNRATAATAGNERSSRSHAVTKITLIGTHPVKGETCVGSVNLVDLAGSESPKTSTRMDETKNINRSLSELSNVILALVQRNEHVPYRNSKLTHLLMPSLGGNSKTLMFVNVAPFQDCLTETVKSLRFASQVNSCKMQKVRKNKMLNSA
ncbi:protein claret segregational [Anopheles cruzii]|uniref:protein claret segregational n=1 Tax=Anopheles cruzii TaxID=68878 RepID=UPI0022EC60FA|nr:protein claret segregational [Anopheles cruzii]